MKKEHYILLIYKNLKGETTIEEQAQLQTWLDASETNRTFEEKVVREWEMSQNYAPKINLDAKADFAKLQTRIRAEKDKKGGAIIVPMRNKRRSFLQIAAAIAVFLGATWWFFLQPTNVEMLLAQTGENEQKSITLADNSVVTLNENSSLEYPTTFSENERKVNVKGEAYFEISSNKSKPFIANTGDLAVTVLGTKFNIYNRENNLTIKVAVIEGSVEVKEKTTTNRVTLTQNQKAQYNKNKQSLKKMTEINTNAAAWKTGILIYKETFWGNIVVDLKQQFGISVTILEKEMLKCPISTSATIPKKDAINTLERLANIANMQLILIDEELQKYQLKGGVCQ